MSDREPVMEAEANLFARCLLMPEHMVRAEVKRIPASGRPIGDILDDNNPFIPEMAKRFGVPLVMMVLRLQELGILEP